MADSINGETVYVCREKNDDPTAGRQENRPLFYICGVLPTESSAAEWKRSADGRDYVPATVGVAESPYR